MTVCLVSTFRTRAACHDDHHLVICTNTIYFTMARVFIATNVTTINKTQLDDVARPKNGLPIAVVPIEVVLTVSQPVKGSRPTTGGFDIYLSGAG